MGRQLNTSISEYPLPDSLSTEIQIIADIISFPETLREAERLLLPTMFSDDNCRNAYNALRMMAKEGMVIDLPSTYPKIDRNLMQKGVIPMMQNVGGIITATQHYATLKEFDIKRKCYFKAVELLAGSCDSNTTSQDLITKTGKFAEDIRKEMDSDKGMVHISQVLHEVGEQLETLQRDRESGKILRVPTGFKELNYITYGGYEVGNLVVLAARPSVGKTAVMLQMAKAAASSGKAANVFSLEMTNSEIARRFLTSESDRLNQWSMARGDVEWSAFEQAVGRLSGKPIYLNDSTRRIDDIIAKISLTVMGCKCDIAFIDYLGLIKFHKGNNLSQAIAEVTGDLKALAMECKIPIVLLCQLNRSSASEKRPPEMHDLRDSGGIEQDADIVLMLERATDDEDGREVNMWVRKNRQGKAGNYKIEIVANETFSAFTEKNDDSPPPPAPPVWQGMESNDMFDNDNGDIPF